jgi:hypothetical protein
MGASASAHSDFISRFREYDDCLAAAKAKGKAFRLVKPHEVVTSPLLASQDLGRLKGSLMMVKASYSPVYGEWMAVLPSAVASATHIEVTLLGVHLGKQVIMEHEALSGLIIGVALGFLSDPASRRLDPFFRTHGEAAVPLVSSAISVSGGVPGAVLNDLPTRAYLEAPFQQLTLDAFVEGAQGSQRVVSTTHSVSSGLNHALPGQGPLGPRISPWLVSNEDDFAVRQQAASLKVAHLLGFPVALDIGRGGGSRGPPSFPWPPSLAVSRSISLTAECSRIGPIFRPSPQATSQQLLGAKRGALRTSGTSVWVWHWRPFLPMTDLLKCQWTSQGPLSPVRAPSPLHSKISSPIYRCVSRLGGRRARSRSRRLSEQAQTRPLCPWAFLSSQAMQQGPGRRSVSEPGWSWTVASPHHCLSPPRVLAQRRRCPLMRCILVQGLIRLHSQLRHNQLSCSSR